MAPGSISAACSRAACREWLRAAFVALCLAAAPSFAAAEQVVQSADTALWLRLQRAAWVTQGARRPAHLIYVTRRFKGRSPQLWLPSARMSDSCMISAYKARRR